MDYINSAKWAMKDHKSTEELRAIRTGLKSLEVATSVEGREVIGNLTEMIIARDPNCLEAKVNRLGREIKRRFL